MPKIVIIGAGAVGTTLAYTLQVSGLMTELVLVDVDQQKAKGEVMDMQHGLFFVPPVKITAGDYTDCAGADMVVVTAGARQRVGESRLDLIGRNTKIVTEIIGQIVEQTTDAVILMITNPVDVLTYIGQRHAGLRPGQLFGSGTVLDSARFRYLVSQHCRVDPRNVHAYVMGEHGDSEVLIWSLVSIAGVPLETYCLQAGCEYTQAVRQQITVTVRESAYHVIQAKGATNFAVSLAARRIIETVLRDEHSVLTVSTQLTEQYGLTGVCLSAPCIVGRSGIVQILECPLTDEEMTELKHSADVLRTIQRQVISSAVV
ncbi:MAG: L-lactate dehydrogenase [Candidatus Latescibacteria bacterium]|nr:L-lactate dehydrogenase [Candidatus Latescibacterota bacterium]